MTARLLRIALPCVATGLLLGACAPLPPRVGGTAAQPSVFNDLPLPTEAEVVQATRSGTAAPRPPARRRTLADAPAATSTKPASTSASGSATASTPTAKSVASGGRLPTAVREAPPRSVKAPPTRHSTPATRPAAVPELRVLREAGRPQRRPASPPKPVTAAPAQPLQRPPARPPVAPLVAAKPAPSPSATAKPRVDLAKMDPRERRCYVQINRPAVEVRLMRSTAPRAICHKHCEAVLIGVQQKRDHIEAIGIYSGRACRLPEDSPAAPPAPALAAGSRKR